MRNTRVPVTNAGLPADFGFLLLGSGNKEDGTLQGGVLHEGSP